MNNLFCPSSDEAQTHKQIKHMQLDKTSVLTAAQGNLTTITESLETVKDSNTEVVAKNAQALALAAIKGEAAPSFTLLSVQDKTTELVEFIERLQLTTAAGDGSVTVSDLEYNKFVKVSASLPESIKFSGGLRH